MVLRVIRQKCVRASVLLRAAGIGFFLGLYDKRRCGHFCGGVRLRGDYTQVAQPKNTTFDATLSERIKLLEKDPEQYFAKYPRTQFDFLKNEKSNPGRRKKRQWARFFGNHSS